MTIRRAARDDGAILTDISFRSKAFWGYPPDYFVIWKNWIKQIDILADPNARGFYEKMGCGYKGEIPSTIPGRTTPHLFFHAASNHKKMQRP